MRTLFYWTVAIAILAVGSLAGAQEVFGEGRNPKRASPPGAQLVSIELEGRPGEAIFRGGDGKAEMRVRLQAVSVGGVPLAIDLQALPVIFADALEFARGEGVVESYAAIGHGFEQAFRIERPATFATGALVVSLAVDVNGLPGSVHPDGRGGYWITGGSSFAFRMSPVNVVGADGRIFPAKARSLRQGSVEFVLPAASVAELVWPIVVDPFIDLITFLVNVSAFASGNDETEPDLAHDTALLDAHLVAWRYEDLNSGDHDVLYNLVERDPGTGLRQSVLPVDEVAFLSGDDEGRPRVAFLNDGSISMYAIVFDSEDGGGDHDIILTYVEPDGQNRSQIILAGSSGPDGDDDTNPAIGADPFTGQYLAVWERRSSTGTADIVGRAFDNKFNFGPIFTISTEGVIAGGANPSNQTLPAISALPILDAGFNDAWVVAYEDDALGATEKRIAVCFIPTQTLVPQDHFNIIPSAATSSSRVRPDVAAVSGASSDQIGLVAHVIEFPSGDKNLQVRLVEWDGATGSFSGQARTLNEATANIDDNPAVAHRFFLPSIAGDPLFVMAYEREDTTTGLSFINVVEFDVELGLGNPVLVVGEYVASWLLGTQRWPRMQWTNTAIEEALLVRSTDELGDFDIAGTQFTEAAVTVQGNADEDFENASIPAGTAGFPWTTSGTVPWVVTAGAGIGGSKAAQSGSFASVGNSVLSITLDTTRDGMITFFRSLSGLSTNKREAGDGDQLIFRVDGTELGYWSGDRDYAQVAFFIPAGTHVFEWELNHENSTTRPVVFLDDISFPPIAAPDVTGLTFAPASPVAGQAVQFTATVTGVATGFDWDFGDGTTAQTTTNTVTHAYAAPGNYTASVTATGPGGADTESAVVPVGAGGGGGTGGGTGFAVTLAANPTRGRRPLSVTFTATVSGGTAQQFTWETGDGAVQTVVQTGTVGTFAHTYQRSGKFQAKVTVLQLGGGAAATSNTVTIDVAATGPSGAIGSGGDGGGCAFSPAATGAPGVPLWVALLVGVTALLKAIARRRLRAAPGTARN